MPKIMKVGKVVGTFGYDPVSLKFELATKDPVVLRVSKNVSGIKGKYDPENNTMIGYAADLQPGDPDYAFHFLVFLKNLGYEVKE